MREWWSRRSQNQKLLIVATGVVIVIIAVIDSSNDPDPILAEEMTTPTESPEEHEPDVTTSDSSDTTETSMATTAGAEVESSEDAYCVREGNSMLIDPSCFPDNEWPLSAEEGILICHPVDAVTFTGGGGVYAVNGMAMTQEIGGDIDPIWLDNSDIEGTKISIGPLIDLGLTLCD